MVTYLKYSHHNQLFLTKSLRPWVLKWFPDLMLLAMDLGGSNIVIGVTNWDLVKDRLPKKYYPAVILGPEDYVFPEGTPDLTEKYIPCFRISPDH